MDTRTSRLPKSIAGRLRIPLIVAPMLRVSGPQLVIAACAAGAIGAFPVANARDSKTLDKWLDRISGAAADVVGPVAPHCPNLVMRHTSVSEHIDVLVQHRVEMVITSVGSPRPAVGPLHGVGCTVFADVATLEHARKAIDAGVDGLVLLSAGAGGHTGWMNPLAFVRAVRQFYDGPIVLGGGVSDGTALRAAEVLGADLAYMGTHFVAATESMAPADYRDLLVASELDDVILTRAFSGLPANMLRPAIINAGLDPDRLDETVDVATAEELVGGKRSGQGPQRWTEIYSSGHSVSGVHRIAPAADLVARIAHDYHRASMPAPSGSTEE